MPKSPRSPREPNRRVVALAYDGLCTFEFGIVAEIFGLDRPEMGEDWYRFSVAGIDPGPLRAGGGVKVTVDGGLDDVAEAGLVVIPGWRGTNSPVPTDLKRALSEAYNRGARILTVCSGAFALAATGLLDGRRATTHWRYMPQFERMFPKVQIERDVLYVDEGQLLTSAGSAAGIDLCLHLVRRDFGTKAVNAVARRLVVPPHRDGGQAQYVEQPVPSSYEGARLSSLIAKMSRRLSEPLSISSLAREARMSERTFIRRFQATTGMAPGRWITRERVRLARSLLESTSASIDDVANRCGFADASSLRKHFLIKVGVSPASYRQRFGVPDALAR